MVALSRINKSFPVSLIVLLFLIFGDNANAQYANSLNPNIISEDAKNWRFKFLVEFDIPMFGLNKTSENAKFTLKRHKWKESIVSRIISEQSIGVGGILYSPKSNFGIHTSLMYDNRGFINSSENLDTTLVKIHSINPEVSLVFMTKRKRKGKPLNNSGIALMVGAGLNIPFSSKVTNTQYDNLNNQDILFGNMKYLEGGIYWNFVPSSKNELRVSDRQYTSEYSTEKSFFLLGISYKQFIDPIFSDIQGISYNGGLGYISLDFKGIGTFISSSSKW